MNTQKIYTIEEIKAMIAPIALQFGISKIWLFGSYARGEATPQSDIDLRVSEGENTLDFFGFSEFIEALENALNKPVDIVFSHSLKENYDKLYIRLLCKNIKRDEVKIYERRDVA